MMSIIFRGRQFSCAHIYLNRRQDQFGQTKSFIASVSHVHKVRLSDTIMYLYVGSFLNAYRRFPFEGIAPISFIVMAQKHASLVWQFEYFLN